MYAYPNDENTVEYFWSNIFEAIYMPNTLRKVAIISAYVKAKKPTKSTPEKLKIEDITSVGWLWNADNTIALTFCLKSQNEPVFVSISKEEYRDAGEIEGFKVNKQQIVYFYNKYGEGRVYKGNKKPKYRNFIF